MFLLAFSLISKASYENIHKKVTYFSMSALFVFFIINSETRHLKGNTNKFKIERLIITVDSGVEALLSKRTDCTCWNQNG